MGFLSSKCWREQEGGWVREGRDWSRGGSKEGLRDLHVRRGSVLRQCWGSGRGRILGRIDRTWSCHYLGRVVRERAGK